MGLGRWWITHGPGSPGSTAKAMAITYSRIRAAYPNATKTDVLLTTIRARYSESEIDEDTVLGMIKRSKGKLANLTQEIVLLENSAAIGAMINAPDVFGEMLNVIIEVTERYAPGA
jgi:hypothetical protein